AGEMANVPVMIDFGGHIPELSLEKLFMDELRPGDIFTHCYAHVNGRTSIVDESGKVRPFVWDAQKRGIVFDVGHGGGSFRFEQAVPASEQGFKPNSISTDLHTGSMNGAMKDMPNIMSKFLAMGMTVQEVIEASTWKPAQIINREELGNLSEGSGADIALFSLEEGSFGYLDIVNKKISGDRRFICELTIRDGKVVWDLNGLSGEPYDK
ncbi:MAG: amidohydrolase family protein, partial [Cyclobacteriaceae bacterium]|nr:amidohydrolase family protein [Cyclobacteriaceae bacterium]